MAGSRKRTRQHRRIRETPAARYASKPRQGITGVLLDSDVVIEILRGRAAVVEAAKRVEGSGIPTFCTPLTVAEIHAGLRSGEEAATEAFFDVFYEA